MFKKILLSLNNFGWRVSVGYLLHKFLQRVSRANGCFIYYIYQQPFKDALSKSIMGRGKQYSYRWYSDYRNVMDQLPRPIAILKDRFNQQSECLLVFDGDIVVACAWFSFEQYNEDEVRCVFDFSIQDNIVWDYDIYIFPKYRMSRLFLYMWAHIEERYKAKGIRSTLSRITAYNMQSIKSHERLGAQRVDSVCFIKVFSWQLMMSSSQPYLVMSFDKNKRSIFKIKNINNTKKIQ